jgi:UDP-N-acetylmuramoyl-L-alanine---L-glutamate ligase
MYQKLIEYFESRSVLVLGFGREGRSTYAFIRKYYPDKPLGIADINSVQLADDNVRLFTGDGYLDAIKRYDLVMQSPGISMRDVKIPEKVEITGQMDLFLRFTQCVKIGVTGTKGKTTTSTLIFEVLRAAGKPACLIGNIGVPVFDSLEDIEGKTAVIEMSSHQLEFVKASPQIAVLTNIYEEHLDHYNGMMGYVHAKLNIYRFQNENDFFVYNPDQDLSAYMDLKTVKSQKVPVSTEDGEKSAFLKMLTGLNARLKGKHNQQDIYFAAAVARCLEIDDESIKMGIQNFEGIPHRLEPVGVFKGVMFYNDSIATIPASVMLNVEALENVDSLIVGGMDRGIDYSGFLVELETSGVRNLICLPDTGHAIGKKLLETSIGMKIVFADNMEQAVSFAFELTQKGKICLLSPAASSYNTYRDFIERGEHFKQLVLEFGVL